MTTRHRRMEREEKTIKAMMRIYCRDHHGASGVAFCKECRELYDYAMLRLEKCPFQERKTTCGHCPVHCYKPSMREKVKSVMRYSGPRMTFQHPVLAFYHLLDGFRKDPGTLGRSEKNQKKAV